MANLLGTTTIGGHQAIHVGNISSYSGITQATADGRYLLLSGGTMSGNLVFPNDSAVALRNADGSAGFRPDDQYGNIYTWNTSGGYYVDANSYYLRNTAGSVNWLSITGSGTVQANADFRAPIFYDSADTNYYVDPNSNSRLVNLGLGGATPDIRLSVAGDGHLSGYLYLGGSAGTVNSWGTRTVGTSGAWITNSNTVRFDNVGYGSTWSFNINSAGAITINRHIDANTVWGTAGVNTIFVGWYGGKIVLGNNNDGGHDYANAAPGNSLISTNKHYFYKGVSMQNNVQGAEVLSVDGINGRLFTVTDDLSDSLFSVNTIAGLPVIEAFADNTVVIGKYGNATTFNNDGTVTFQNEGIKMPYYNGGTMWFRTNTHWESVSGIDVIGGSGEFRISSNTGAISLRVDGDLISSGDVYLGTRGVNLSSWLNQSVLTSAGPTFANVYSTGWFRTYDANGLYNETHANHWYATSNATWNAAGNSSSHIEIAMRTGGHQGTIRGYVYADNSNNIGFLNNGGSWAVRVSSARNVEIFGSDLTLGALGSNSTNIIMGDNDEGSRTIHCNSNRIGFLTQAGSWGSWSEDNGAWSSVSSMYSPIYYDYDDSNYYLDLNSTSNSAQRIRGGTLHGPNPTWGKYLYVGTDGRVGTNASVAVTNGNLHIDAEDEYSLYLNWYNTSNIYTRANLGVGSDSASYRLHVHGTGYATDDFRAPIFYDSNDTAYYGNFASTSVMNSIRFGTSTNNATLSGNSDWGIRLTTDSGYILFGPANGSYAHIYTDRGSFYFNKNLEVNGNTVATQVWVQSQGYLTGSHNHDDRYYTESESDSRYLYYRGYSTSGNTQTFQSTANTIRFDQVGALDNGSWSNQPTGYYTYGGILSLRGDSFGLQIYGSHTGDLVFKTQWDNDQYSGWRTVIHSSNIGSQSVSYASSAGNADTVDGKHATNNAGNIAVYESNGYLYIPSWLNVNGGGVFSSTNNAHLRPNTGSYGAWEMIGTRNGWSGIFFNDSGDHLMANREEVGHYQNGIGWKFRWYQGEMYISSGNEGGGTERTVIHSGNIGSQSVNYATTAGTANAVAWTNVSSRPTALSQFTNDLGNYGGWLTAAGGTMSGNLTMSGAGDSRSIIFGDSSKQINVEGYWMMFKGHENEGFRWQTAGQDGVTYTTRMQLTTSGLTVNGNTVIHSGNIGSQSVNYASSAGNATTANGANGNFYIDDNYGVGVVGLYSASRYQGVFAMGDSYKLPADGTSTGSLYGLAWSHPNAGGVAGNLNTHGLLVMENGTFLAAISGSIRSRDDMRAPIFYDQNDTNYYLDPNGTSNLLQLTTSTRARWNMPRWWADRSSITSDQNYWTGSNGWGMDQGGWSTAWKGGFSGWDIWGTGTDHPQGSGYIHAQGIVSGQHLATSDGSSGYGWMMVGAGDAVANRYWLRGKWSSTTSEWVEMITTGNVGSQSVNYAASAGAVAASAITGQTGMWTSAARPGAYRLYRNDDNSAYNVQTTWSADVSGYWSLRGYLNDSYHAPCYVGYAGYASSAGTADQIDGRGFRNTGSNDATNADNIESNGITYYSAGVSNFSGNATDGALYSQAYSSAWQHQIAGDYRSGQIALRGKNNGTWQSWRTVLDSSNFSSWAISRGGDTVTGIIYFLTNNGGRSGATDSAKLQAYSTGGNSAFMSFHRGGHYAINFGLDDDNVMRMGGWSAGADLFQMDMSGNLTMKGDVIAFSDARVKTNVQTIEGALEKTLKLRGVTYNRIDHSDTSTKLGVIAQEVLEIIPEVVSQDNNGTYGVSYGNIVGLLIEAIKEQQAQIDDLKKRLGE
jgi:hypothetical protein